MRTVKTRRLIAFTGRARSGKDTGSDLINSMFAEYILKNEDRTCITLQFAFASILKDMAQTSLKINPDDAERLKATPSVKVANGLTLREFYNTLADSLKSYLGQDLWIRMTTESIQDIIDMIDMDLIIISDLRYPIEEEGLREFCKKNNIEFTIIKMKNLNHSQRDDNLSQTEHESEALVDNINEDYIVSAADVPELTGKLKEIFIQLTEDKGEDNEPTSTTTTDTTK